jgi:hypothetical protein
MAHAYTFAVLKLYGEKQHRFQQHKSMPLTEWSDGTLNEGICVVMALHWIDAMVNNKSPFESTMNFSDVHAQNAAVMLSREAPHGAYGDGILISQLITSSHFRLQFSIAYATDVTPTAQPVTTNLLERVVAPSRLAPGTGVVMAIHITLGNDTGMHAVAMFRDRAGELFFFDANCGEYKVKNSGKFFDELISIYNARFSANRQTWYVKAR